ncbi:hypothetical protein [Stenotrophomonas maltophilia]|uniref:hypothetical protein n=1 Tax=Stenotrophomonas maltophilia TaxID=40324 RepID=UPI0015DF86C0|nr:hypothetical protein [Stenotrophomonas maltophilia]MBA0362752.1 hypothetical protein [Stenotrophomonas maltophilia]
MLIGDITKGLMDAHGLGVEALAARVRAAGAPNVKYQHLQQLLEIPTRRPRYLPELAKAFGLTVEQFLQWDGATGNGSLATQSVQSQSLQLDAPTLAASYQLVRLACLALGTSFDPESTDDAAIVLLAHRYLSARSEQAVTPDNVVDFTAHLRKRQISKGVDDEGSSSTGSTRARTGGQS